MAGFGVGFELACIEDFVVCKAPGSAVSEIDGTDADLDLDEGAFDPDTSAYRDVGISRESPEASFCAWLEIHRFGAPGASAKACRLSCATAGRSQPVLDTDGGDFLIGEIVDHDADYRRGIRIRRIRPEEELNNSDRRILAGGGDGVNAKSNLLCEGRAREAENEREQKEQSLHQVWFRIRFGPVTTV
jgi:hypothetical protein